MEFSTAKETTIVIYDDVLEADLDTYLINRQIEFESATREFKAVTEDSASSSFLGGSSQAFCRKRN